MAITTITNSMVSVNAIQGTLIADNAITAVHIATNAVSGTLIADNAVTATHIAQNTITVTQLADDAVEADKIADGVITTNHLNKAMISSQTEVTAVAGDFVLLGDTSDSNNLKKALVSSLAPNAVPLAGGTMTGPLIGKAVTLAPDTAGKLTIRLTTNAANDGRILLRSDTTDKVDIQANGLSYFDGGNVLIGKKADTYSEEGIALRGDPASAAALATFTRSGANPISLNRLSNDGDMLVFTKDGTIVGSIGAYAGDVYIGEGDTALRFNANNDLILPFNSTSGSQATRDAAIDLGTSSGRFKDLYLSGIASIGNLKIGTDQGTDGQVLTSTGSGVAWEDAAGGVAGISSSADATAITITSGEEVGIGTTTTFSNPLTLNKAAGAANSLNNQIALTHTGASTAYHIKTIRAAGTDEPDGIAFVENTTERMRIRGGSVGINETTPDFSGFGSNGGGLELDDVGSSFTAVRVNQGSTGDFYMAVSTGAAYLWGKANSPTVFGTNNTEKMRLDESGSLGLGTNNPGSLLHVAHSNGGANPTARIENTTGTVATNSVLLDLKFSGDDSFSNCDYLRFQDSSGEEGVITGDGGGRVYYEINSDYRLKENVLDYSGGLNKIKALSVKRYNYKTRPGTTYTGFLAHEVAEVVDGVARGTKDAVNPDGTPDYQGMDLSKLVPELVSAIQELEARVKTLER